MLIGCAVEGKVFQEGCCIHFVCQVAGGEKIKNLCSLLEVFFRLLKFSLSPKMTTAKRVNFPNHSTMISIVIFAHSHQLARALSIPKE
jgi:hypothetical protein